VSQIVGFRKDRRTGKTHPIYSTVKSTVSKVAPSSTTLSILARGAGKAAGKVLHYLKVIVEDVATRVYTGAKPVLTELMKFIQTEAKNLGLAVKFELEKLNILGSKGITHPVKHLELRKNEMKKFLQRVQAKRKS